MKALSHPLRVVILDYMNERDWSPREIEKETGVGLSQVSYHVKVLKDFEMIELTKTAPRRGAVEHYYRAVERAFVSSGPDHHASPGHGGFRPSSSLDTSRTRRWRAGTASPARPWAQECGNCIS